MNIGLEDVGFSARDADYDRIVELSYIWPDGKWASIRIEKLSDCQYIALQLKALASIISGEVKPIDEIGDVITVNLSDIGIEK